MVRNHLTESDTVPPTGSAISGLSRLVDRRSLDMIEASRLDDGDEDDLMVIPPIVSGGNGDPEKKEEESEIVPVPGAGAADPLRAENNNASRSDESQEEYQISVRLGVLT